MVLIVFVFIILKLWNYDIIWSSCFFSLLFINIRGNILRNCHIPLSKHSTRFCNDTQTCKAFFFNNNKIGHQSFIIEMKSSGTKQNKALFCIKEHETTTITNDYLKWNYALHVWNVWQFGKGNFYISKNLVINSSL